jgi:hypothetical protein
MQLLRAARGQAGSSHILESREIFADRAFFLETIG